MENQDQIIQGLLQLNNMMTEQIGLLQSDNASLKQEVENLKYAVSELIKGQKSIVDTISNNQREVKMLGKTMTRSSDNVPYEMGQGIIPSPKVATIEETVDLIANSRASICRFGDGEFSIMMGCSRQGFQHQDDRLAERLIQVMKSNEADCLIAIADNYGSLNRYSEMSKNEIRYYMTDEVRKDHLKYFDLDRKYYNAYITTPYMLYGDRDTDNPRIRFEALKSIWDKKNIVIVEGRLSRLGVKNDLFANARTINRILCPPEHAFDRYEEILNAAQKAGEKYKKDDFLYIIALGPTATVLAYDLYKLGYQALDLGHIDNDYEYFLRQASERTLISGKYINNLTKVEDVEDIDDAEYEMQIIEIV